MTRLAYLHGFASGPGSTKARVFRARLAERGHTLAVPDLAPDFTNMTITSQLAIADALLDAGPTILFGSSLGGYLAALAAARRPDRVPALVLMAPAFGFAARWEHSVGEAAMAKWRARGTAPVFHYGRDREEPLSIALLDDARRYPEEPDPTCPALVLHGRRDDAVPLEAAERFVARRGALRRLVVYESGHELTDVLDALWSESLEFLRERGI
ncbi:MAG TPA: YqiA/YcfP family alpha/beta fold hydrolase [Candidatus Eisenbacteria bacterium]|nr:YqiA/YcfP family alpha/beta fold hydrolase [Candidatus Eisenbacteria bacterium]